jgi:hypothetical protein
VYFCCIKRSKLITILCVLGFCGTVFNFPQVFSPSIKKLGVFIPGLFGLIISLQFIALVGVWYTKKWGVELFLISFFCKLFFSIYYDLIGFSFYFGILFSVLSSIVFCMRYRYFSANL